MHSHCRNFSLAAPFYRCTVGANILLVAIALNPAAIFQVTQHGNFDVLMALWIVLGIDSLVQFHREHRKNDWLLACLWLGLGVLTKTIPLILAPLLAIDAKKLSARDLIAGIFLFLAPATIGVGVLFAISPQYTINSIFSYQSIGGSYGITGILSMFRADELISLHKIIFKLAACGAIFLLSAFLYRSGLRSERKIVLLGAVILLAVPTLGPGYAAQYVYWTLPLFAVAWAAFEVYRWRRLLIFSLIILAATDLFEYLFFQPNGALARHLFPQSQFVQNTMIIWNDPVGQTQVRLPLFCASGDFNCGRSAACEKKNYLDENQRSINLVEFAGDVFDVLDFFLIERRAIPPENIVKPQIRLGQFARFFF